MSEAPLVRPGFYNVRMDGMSSDSPFYCVDKDRLCLMLEMLVAVDASDLPVPTIEVWIGHRWARVRHWDDVARVLPDGPPGAPDASPTPAAAPSPAEHLAAPLQERNLRLARCLSAFSAMLSDLGAWTPECQAMLDEARALEPLTSPMWSPTIARIREAADALNRAMVGAAREGLSTQVSVSHQDTGGSSFPLVSADVVRVSPSPSPDFPADARQALQ